MFLLAVILCEASGLAACREKAPVAPSVIRIGASYPAKIIESQTRLLEGLNLALEEINAAGGVMGAPVEILFYDDGDNPEIAMQIADRFSAEGVTAVIGHWSSDVCYYAEDVYEKAGVVMLSPGATSTGLFKSDYQYIFRMLPGDDVFAGYLAEFAEQKKLRRIAMFYSDDEFGRDLSKFAERALKRYGIPVVDRVNVLTPASMEDIFVRWDAFGADAVLIAANLQEAAEPVSLICERYPDMPVISSESLNKLTVRSELGLAVDDLYTVTYSPSIIDINFQRRYEEKFGNAPDIFAISGFVAMHLITEAMNSAQSSSGDAVAAWLRSVQNHDTVIGPISYNEKTRNFDGQPFIVTQITR
ncbi:MAG: ABC transporter substrate-binding protein [Spirochaetaceae bacterium]|nr:ABC transporter substrate-binding protein [Spirochaetaceae bacterium]